MEVTRSLTGTGLRTEGRGQISFAPVTSAKCPVEPSNCNKGLTVSVFIKAVGLYLQFQSSRFLLGNSLTDGQNGFMVGVFDGKLQIYVRTKDYVCSSVDQPVKANVWFHLGFSWKSPIQPDGGLTVFIDGTKVNPNYVNCENIPLQFRHTYTTIKLGSFGHTAEPAAEFDHLAIWYQARAWDILAPWNYVRGKLLLW